KELLARLAIEVSKLKPEQSKDNIAKRLEELEASIRDQGKRILFCLQTSLLNSYVLDANYFQDQFVDRLTPFGPRIVTCHLTIARLKRIQDVQLMMNALRVNMEVWSSPHSPTPLTYYHYPYLLWYSTDAVHPSSRFREPNCFLVVKDTWPNYVPSYGFWNKAPSPSITQHAFECRHHQRANAGSISSYVAGMRTAGGCCQKSQYPHPTVMCAKPKFYTFPTPPMASSSTSRARPKEKPKEKPRKKGKEKDKGASTQHQLPLTTLAQSAGQTPQPALIAKFLDIDDMEVADVSHGTKIIGLGTENQPIEFVEELDLPEVQLATAAKGKGKVRVGVDPVLQRLSALTNMFQILQMAHSTPTNPDDDPGCSPERHLRIGLFGWGKINVLKWSFDKLGFRQQDVDDLDPRKVARFLQTFKKKGCFHFYLENSLKILLPTSALQPSPAKTPFVTNSEGLPLYTEDDILGPMVTANGVHRYFALVELNKEVTHTIDVLAKQVTELVLSNGKDAAWAAKQLELNEWMEYESVMGEWQVAFFNTARLSSPDQNRVYDLKVETLFVTDRKSLPLINLVASYRREPQQMQSAWLKKELTALDNKRLKRVMTPILVRRMLNHALEFGFEFVNTLMFNPKWSSDHLLGVFGSVAVHDPSFPQLEEIDDVLGLLDSESAQEREYAVAKICNWKQVMRNGSRSLARPWIPVIPHLDALQDKIFQNTFGLTGIESGHAISCMKEYMLCWSDFVNNHCQDFPVHTDIIIGRGLVLLAPVDGDKTYPSRPFCSHALYNSTYQWFQSRRHPILEVCRWIEALSDYYRPTGKIEATADASTSIARFFQRIHPTNPKGLEIARGFFRLVLFLNRDGLEKLNHEISKPHFWAYRQQYLSDVQLGAFVHSHKQEVDDLVALLKTRDDPGQQTASRPGALAVKGSRFRLKGHLRLRESRLKAHAAALLNVETLVIKYRSLLFHPDVMALRDSIQAYMLEQAGLDHFAYWDQLRQPHHLLDTTGDDEKQRQRIEFNLIERHQCSIQQWIYKLEDSELFTEHIAGKTYMSAEAREGIERLIQSSEDIAARRRFAILNEDVGKIPPFDRTREREKVYLHCAVEDIDKCFAEAQPSDLLEWRAYVIECENNVDIVDDIARSVSIQGSNEEPGQEEERVQGREGEDVGSIRSMGPTTSTSNMGDVEPDTRMDVDVDSEIMGAPGNVNDHNYDTAGSPLSSPPSESATDMEEDYVSELPTQIVNKLAESTKAAADLVRAKLAESLPLKRTHAAGLPTAFSAAAIVTPPTGSLRKSALTVSSHTRNSDGANRSHPTPVPAPQLKKECHVVKKEYPQNLSQRVRDHIDGPEAKLMWEYDHSHATGNLDSKAYHWCGTPCMGVTITHETLLASASNTHDEPGVLALSPMSAKYSLLHVMLVTPDRHSIGSDQGEQEEDTEGGDDT
ncbi:hypothetical protein BDN72DRAFT_865636, partial [Pluteus cervinus]